MPFIWDDEEYLLVDDQEEYNKDRFCIIRTLFVTPMIKNGVSNPSLFSDQEKCI